MLGRLTVAALALATLAAAGASAGEYDLLSTEHLEKPIAEPAKIWRCEVVVSYECGDLANGRGCNVRDFTQHGESRTMWEQALEIDFRAQEIRRPEAPTYTFDGWRLHTGIETEFQTIRSMYGHPIDVTFWVLNDGSSFQFNRPGSEKKRTVCTASASHNKSRLHNCVSTRGHATDRRAKHLI